VMKIFPSPGGISSSLIEECTRQSSQLLRRNLIPEGILAATPGEQAQSRNYHGIFGRDAAICALGMLSGEDQELLTGARASLLTLAQYQAANGQIPKFVLPQSGEADFWYTGCIDATLWWLIAQALHDRFHSGHSLAPQMQPAVEKALNWLHCQEHPGWHLLQQNEASDWADIMPRSGFVLYSNALWYWVKRLYNLSGHEETRHFANVLLFPEDRDLATHKRLRLMSDYAHEQALPQDFYLSFVNFSMCGTEVDVFGNILAGLCGLADQERANSIASAIMTLTADSPRPLQVVGLPLQTDNPLWRRYMERHNQNLPFQYHNGGSWPFVGGFLVLLLARLGHYQEAREQLERLAAANAVNDWQFNEWFHGRSGQPMGMAGQSWNAAMFLAAHTTMDDGPDLFA